MRFNVTSQMLYKSISVDILSVSHIGMNAEAAIHWTQKHVNIPFQPGFRIFYKSSLSVSITGKIPPTRNFSKRLVFEEKISFVATSLHAAGKRGYFGIFAYTTHNCHKAVLVVEETWIPVFRS